VSVWKVKQCENYVLTDTVLTSIFQVNLH